MSRHDTIRGLDDLPHPLGAYAVTDPLRDRRLRYADAFCQRALRLLWKIQIIDEFHAGKY